MKAIILAAGVGSRLRPITDRKPKTMVEVNGKPMLGYILDSLWSAGVDGAIICTGYQEERIRDYCHRSQAGRPVDFVSNDDYEITNNMYSLYLARDYMDGEFLLMNADLVFDKSIIAGLVAADGSRVAVDEGNYFEESMKIEIRPEGSIKAISKKITKTAAFGSSIDVYKIAANDVAALKKGLCHYIEDLEDKKQWTEVLLDSLFSTEAIKARPYPINPARWFEIDNFEDLAKAEKLFSRDIWDIKERKLFFIDRDGTLAVKEKAIEGAGEFLAALRAAGKKVFILTNNSSKTPEEHRNLIGKLGLKLSLDEVLVSIDSCLTEFKKLGFERVFWLANRSVSSYILSRGFQFDAENPQALLMTYDDEVVYDEIVTFCRMVRRGLPYYATHIDQVCPDPQGSVPDIGCFIEVVSRTTGQLPIRTFGKPCLDMILPILEREGLSLKDAVMIGDRLYTDIAMATGTDMLSVLVLSGETDRSSYEASTTRANIVVPQISDLIDYI